MKIFYKINLFFLLTTSQIIISSYNDLNNSVTPDIENQLIEVKLMSDHNSNDTTYYVLPTAQLIPHTNAEIIRSNNPIIAQRIGNIRNNLFINLVDPSDNQFSDDNISISRKCLIKTALASSLTITAGIVTLVLCIPKSDTIL